MIYRRQLTKGFKHVCTTICSPCEVVDIMKQVLKAGKGYEGKHEVLMYPVENVSIQGKPYLSMEIQVNAHPSIHTEFQNKYMGW